MTINQRGTNSLPGILQVVILLAMPTPEVSVIVPTLALPERRDLLLRALASIASQDGIRCLPLVVVNGNLFDPNLVGDLARDPHIRLIIQEEDDLPAAYRLGRQHVATPWFTSLDDDDLLLPGTLRKRVRALQQSDEFDCLITNGFCRGTHGDRLHVSDMAKVAADPLRELMRFNWLLPGAWLCRTNVANEELFEGMPSYIECTYLAIRLVTTLRVLFTDDPTVVWHTDTPGSASKSRAFALGQPHALRRILELDLPPSVRQCFKSRLANAYHASSALLLEDGMTISAWKEHARALFEQGGWRYLAFTRRLLARSIAILAWPARESEE